MTDTELLLALAEIAGVFVGFGALIAIRSGGASGAFEVAPMRTVVWTGMVTIVAALAPVTIGRYDLADHAVLASSSVLVLVSYFGIALISIRTPEYRAVWTTSRRGRFQVVESVASLLLVGGPVIALLVIAAGLLPGVEAALYVTVVVLILIQAAWTLLWLVFMERPGAR